MRYNLIAEPSDSTQLPSSVQCAPTYYILGPGFNRVAVGLRNGLAKAVIIPSQTVLAQLQQARMVPNDKASKLQDTQGPTGRKGGSWILDQLHL